MHLYLSEEEDVYHEFSSFKNTPTFYFQSEILESEYLT